MHRMVVMSLATLAFACGDDDGVTRPRVSEPPAPAQNLNGRWGSHQMWLTQFHRTHDGYNGSWTCSGNLTIAQTAGSRTFTGFAVVGAPCPAISFDLNGTIEASGAMTINMSGPRPGAGSCPQPPRAQYTGTFDGRTISVRTQVRVDCPGAGEG